MAPPKKRIKLKRLDIQLEPSLLAWLRLEAKRRDVSMSEIIRCLLRKELESK
uniref:Putative ribbon-helix-helix protein repressor n=1 Tax=viral metagenome TaxID=1070528 RepID=A0A6H2A5A6_9ZZZZ